MISIALQREVPQYIAIPWFITCVIARTISVQEEKDESSMKFHINPTIYHPNYYNIYKQL